MKIIVITVIIVINIILPLVANAQPNLDEINQRVCNRFEEDLRRLAAIMEELRRRKGITETRVAFGGVDTSIKSADYWITYSAEALAYQRVKKYSSTGGLRSDLRILAGEVLRAKLKVKEALNEK